MTSAATPHAHPPGAITVGNDSDEAVALTSVVCRSVGGGALLLGLELDTSPVDEALARGTTAPRIGVLDGADIAERCGGDQPLPDDTTSRKAVLEAAHRASVPVIVLRDQDQRSLRRTLHGSAARDLIEHSDLPVLLVGTGATDGGRPA